MENIKEKKVGRPKIEITSEFIEVWKKWREGNYYKTTVQAIRESHTSKTTFYRFNKILQNGYDIMQVEDITR